MSNRNDLVIKNLTDWIENSDTLYNKLTCQVHAMATQIEYDGKHIKADDFKGKKVIDREGIEYGNVKHIHINTDTLEVVGITVHKGLHKDHFLSRD